jgi:hypothetical protein
MDAWRARRTGQEKTLWLQTKSIGADIMSSDLASTQMGGQEVSTLHVAQDSTLLHLPKELDCPAGLFKVCLVSLLVRQFLEVYFPAFYCLCYGQRS